MGWWHSAVVGNTHIAGRMESTSSCYILDCLMQILQLVNVLTSFFGYDHRYCLISWFYIYVGCLFLDEKLMTLLV